jgi:hypothetical protein
MKIVSLHNASRRNGVIVAVAIFGVIGVVFLQTSPSSDEHVEQSELPQTKEVQKQGKTKRSIRKGPRKPPILQNKPTPPVNKEKEVSKQETDKDSEKKGEEDSEEIQEKREEYFETLDSIENPSTSELIMLGELAFYANEPESAYEHYLDVIDNHSDDPMAPFALYKFAWVQYNLGDVGHAIQDMELVLEWMETGEIKQAEILEKTVPTDLEFFMKNE